MAETLTIRTASSTEIVKIAVPGPQGPAGQGVPVGGSTGQVLRKKTGTDYDTEWAAAGSGSGSVTSVALASTDLTISGSPITSSGTITANIAANAVTLEKLQTISSEHLLGRHGSGNGGVQQIGLGTGLAISGSNVGVTFGSSAGTACQGNDSRLSDSRNAIPHAASHASSGSDPLAPSDIGGVTAQTTTTLFPTGNVALTAVRNSRILIYSVNITANIDLPFENNIVGDTITLSAAGFSGTNLFTIRRALTMSGGTPSIYTNLVTISNQGEQYTFRSDGTATGWTRVFVDTHTHAAGDVTSGTLAHERGGLEADVSAYSGLVKISGGSTSAVTVTSAGEALLDDADAAAQRTTLGLGTAATAATGDFAAASHTHELTALAATGATNGHVLTANGSNGATFAALPASGVTGAAASASDVLGVSGANITGVDANADRIVYWNNTSNKLAYGTPADAGAAAASHTHAASDVTSGTFDNARINFAAPAAIGNTTPNTGAFTSLSTAPAANTSALTTTGYSLTGSNAQSLVDLAGAWNTTGTPSAFKLNITDTASNASSLLMQLQTGGTNRFTVSKGGAVVCASSLTASALAISGADFVNNGFPVFRALGTEILAYTTNPSTHVSLRVDYSYGFNNGSPTGGATDVRMWRDAAATWALRDGVNAQEMRCYGTYTSSTNYQRMTIKSVKQTLSALSGASATTTGTFIPDGAVVVGVTTRVATALTGAAGYTIGDGTDADRWGDITGTAIGTTSDNRDWTAGTIECFTAGGNITLTAKTSNFTAGAIEVCVFYLAGEAD